MQGLVFFHIPNTIPFTGAKISTHKQKNPNTHISPWIKHRTLWIGAWCLKPTQIWFICVMHVCSKHFINTTEECRKYVNLFRRVGLYVKYGEKDHIHDCYKNNTHLHYYKINMRNSKQNASKVSGEFQSILYHLWTKDISSLWTARAIVFEKQSYSYSLYAPSTWKLGVHLYVHICPGKPNPHIPNHPNIPQISWKDPLQCFFSSMSRSYVFSSLQFLTETSYRSYPSYACFMSHPSHPPWYLTQLTETTWQTLQTLQCCIRSGWETCENYFIPTKE